MTKEKEYPYRHVLEDSKFYPDEAYFEAKEEGDMDMANGCDMCLEPAEFMTFSTAELEYEDDPDLAPEDDDCGAAYYICKACVKKYKLEDMLEDPEWAEDCEEGCDCDMCKTEQQVQKAVQECADRFEDCDQCERPVLKETYRKNKGLCSVCIDAMQ